jgi:iron(III) transport system ATP-binding protein
MMVTGTGGGFRLTAIVDHVPSMSVGDKVHFGLPSAPSALFAANGERLS